MDEIRLLHLGPEDHDILLRAPEELFAAPLEPSQVFQYLAQGTHEMVLAMAAGRAVGMASGLVIMRPDIPPKFYISEVSVLPTWRRKGVATALVGRLRDIAADRGCTDVWGMASAGHDAAKGIFHKLKQQDAYGIALFEWSDIADQG